MQTKVTRARPDRPLLHRPGRHAFGDGLGFGPVVPRDGRRAGSRAVVITPNDAQQIRDACDLRSCCAACGHQEAERNPLVLAEDGYRVHLSHTLDPASGYYGLVFTWGKVAA